MSTGWKWITSDGQEFKNQLYARRALRENPDLKIYFSELSMAGRKLTDVTEELRPLPGDPPDYEEVP